MDNLIIKSLILFLLMGTVPPIAFAQSTAGDSDIEEATTPEPQAEATTPEPQEEATTQSQEEATTLEPQAEATTQPQGEATTPEPQEEATTPEPQEEATTPEPQEEATTQYQEEATTQPQEEETTQPQEEPTTQPPEEPTTQPQEKPTTQPPEPGTTEPPLTTTVKAQPSGSLGQTEKIILGAALAVAILIILASLIYGFTRRSHLNTELEHMYEKHLQSGATAASENSYEMAEIIEESEG